MKTNWIIALLLFINLSVVGQIIEHEFRCGTITYSFELPNDFRTSHSHYTEGDYNIFYRLDTIAKTDTTRLTLHCGSMVQLPHLDDSTFIVETTTKFKRTGTQLNGRFWMELNLSEDINIFYQDATYEEKELLNDAIWKLLNRKRNPRLTNTTEYNQNNIYLNSLNILLDSLSVTQSGIFIIEGNPVNRVHSKFLSHKVLNAEAKRMFNHKRHLLKDFEYLVGEDLIRLRARPIYIEESRVKVPIIIAKTIYSTRKRMSSELIMDVQWTFIYKLNSTTNSFELESIDKGMEL